MTAAFWAGRRVFVTGHTGFKGAWLTMWLRRLGAVVTGYALDPPTQPNLFDAAGAGEGIRSVSGDVRDAGAVEAALRASEAEVVLHLAAQPLVLTAYADPVATYATNVMGTIHLLDAVRRTPSVRAVVVVTSDKCYDDTASIRPRRETDGLGGRDPYSSSKACAELAAAAYRAAYFGDAAAARIATARAGNVIGGGDWAADRLVPDLLRALGRGETALLRHPNAIRPWQHVLDPLHGYLMLAEALHTDRVDGDAWNFGPLDDTDRPVSWIADRFVARFGGAWRSIETGTWPEAPALRLDSSRANANLGWRPALDLAAAIEWTAEWHGAWQAAGDARTITATQLARFEKLVS